MGAIDGYSRRILWLYVSASNNNPSAFYFLQTITELNRIPQVVRWDRGSENVIVCSVQRFLRRDFDETLSGQASFQYGSSRLGSLNLEEQKELGGSFFKKILLILEFTVIGLITMWKCWDFASCQLHSMNWMKWKKYGTRIM